jgi:hypothetical protein
MRLYCYRCSASLAVQEQLWRFSEYVHALAVSPYSEFYIREDRLAVCLLIDPQLRPVPHKDLVI